MFDLVYGHERQKKLLANMVKNKQVHHGLLFAGPDGIGKRLMALKLGRAMMCSEQTGCGKCKHCHKIDKRMHPDFREIEPEGQDIKVDQIRDIAENLHFRPFEGPVRIFILDQAHNMRDEAANAFLKSLEEPPAYVYFILITSEENKILPTIRSRCQAVPFQGLNLEDKANILQQNFGKEAETAKHLAAISFRQLETEDEALSLFQKNTRLGLDFLKLMLHSGHAVDLFTEPLADKGRRVLFIDHFTALLREMTMTCLGLPISLLFQPFEQEIRELASMASEKEWRTFFQDVVQVETQRRRNLNLGLWFNAASLNQLALLEKAQNAFSSRINRSQ